MDTIEKSINGKGSWSMVGKEEGRQQVRFRVKKWEGRPEKAEGKDIVITRKNVW